MSSFVEIMGNRALPETPGVYYMKNKRGEVIYVGKAGNLRRRVSSYFQKAHDRRISQLVAAIVVIDTVETSSVLEALILEANEIKRLQPKYNVRERDDTSNLYLAFTKGLFPKPELVRGHELSHLGSEKFRSVFGPYLSPASLRAALKILRKIFPYSTDDPHQGRPCFYYHLGLCPGVCVDAIDSKTYQKNIRHLEGVFSGKKEHVLRGLKREMKKASTEERFEEAGALRNQIGALEHIHDVAVLTKEDSPFFGAPVVTDLAVNMFGRIEGYDISNNTGAEPVASMIVFRNGEASKNDYRKFHIKKVTGINDVAMMREVLERRFAHRESSTWPKPDLILIDGGWGQVNVANEVLTANGLTIPLVGIAKGFDRKQDRLIYTAQNAESGRVIEQYKAILIAVRDEAHRFAIGYHRARMRGRLRREG